MDLHLTRNRFAARQRGEVRRRGRTEGGALLPRREPGFLGRRGCARPANSAGSACWCRVAADGLGLGLTELALVLEQAGRGLVCEPIGLAAIAAAALRRARASDACAGHARRGAGGAGAAGERAWRRSAQAAHRKRRSDGGAPRLTGTEDVRLRRRRRRFPGQRERGSDGPALYYVARDAQGCTLATTPTVEGRKLATLNLADTPADLIRPHSESRRRGGGALQSRAARRCPPSCSA